MKRREIAKVTRQRGVRDEKRSEIASTSHTKKKIGGGACYRPHTAIEDISTISKGPAPTATTSTKKRPNNSSHLKCRT